MMALKDNQRLFEKMNLAEAIRSLRLDTINMLATSDGSSVYFESTYVWRSDAAFFEETVFPKSTTRLRILKLTGSLSETAALNLSLEARLKSPSGLYGGNVNCIKN